jgi:hypothetical protein
MKRADYTERYGDFEAALENWLDAYDRALADITARQAAHKARCIAAVERIDRVLREVS